MRLFLYECKKIICSKINFLVLIVFCLISIWIYNGNVFTPAKRDYYDQGEIMSKKEVLKEIALTKQQWTGAMDESWWERLQQTYIENEMRSNEQLFDVEKMNQLYGPGWNLDYALNHQAYTMATDSEAKEGKKQLILRETPLPSIKEDIAKDVTWDIYMNYAEIVLKNKPWNSEDGTYGVMYSGLSGEETPSPVYSSTKLSKAEILMLKEKMNSIDTFYYGDTKSWDGLLNALGVSGILLMIWVLLISTDIVNKERKNQMLEIQRTCVNGKSRLILSKIGAVLVSCIIGFAVMIGGVSLYALLTGGIGDASVSVIEGIYMVSIFNYGQAYFIGVMCILLGAFATAMIGCLVSTFIKSTYRSLALTVIVLYIVPTLFNIFGNIKNLIPVNFMSISNVSVRNFTTMFFGKPYYLYQLLPMIWIPICVLIVFIVRFKYNSKSYPIV